VAGGAQSSDSSTAAAPRSASMSAPVRADHPSRYSVCSARLARSPWDTISSRSSMSRRGRAELILTELQAHPREHGSHDIDRFLRTRGALAQLLELRHRARVDDDVSERLVVAPGTPMQLPSPPRVPGRCFASDFDPPPVPQGEARLLRTRIDSVSDCANDAPRRRSDIARARIGRQHSLSDTAIRKRAKANGWTRDLSGRP
jgi:hypothetical protein